MMIMPSVALAAPAAWQPKPETPQAPWYARWQPFAIWPVKGSVPAKGTGLQYRLTYVANTNEIQLTVTNPTRRSISVTTPSAFTSDFALWKDGTLVWRFSTDRSFAQAVTKQTFKAGQSKTIKQTLPDLPVGTYLAQGYFIGETTRTPVASTNITIKRWPTPTPPKNSDPLEYSVEFLSSSWFNSSPRLRVTIKNTSNKDVTLPYQRGYHILVKKTGAKDYLGNVGMSQSVGTIEAGATRTIFVQLNGLGAGSYQADIKSNVGASSISNYRTVAQTWFYIGR